MARRAGCDPDGSSTDVDAAGEAGERSSDRGEAICSADEEGISFTAYPSRIRCMLVQTPKLITVQNRLRQAITDSTITGPREEGELI